MEDLVYKHISNKIISENEFPMLVKYLDKEVICHNEKDFKYFKSKIPVGVAFTKNKITDTKNR